MGRFQVALGRGLLPTRSIARGKSFGLRDKSRRTRRLRFRFSAKRDVGVQNFRTGGH